MRSVRDASIGARLGFGFAAMLLFSIVIAVVGALQLRHVRDASQGVIERSLEKERLISDWGRNIYVAAVRTTVIAKSGDPALAKYFAEDAAASAKSSSDLLKRIEPLIESPAEKDLFGRLLDIRKTYTASRDEVMQLQGAGKTDEAAHALETRFTPVVAKYRKSVADLIDLQRSAVDSATREIDATALSSRNVMIVLAAAVAALGFSLAWFLTRGIVGPLRRAVAIAERVAGGDLTTRIVAEHHDETGNLLRALQKMNDALRAIVHDVTTGTSSIATASTQIASGSQDLSRRTEQQASSLEETAATMEELTATVKQNADNARQADRLAASASEVAVKGGDVVSQVVTTMGGIDESSRKIADIIAVIDSIAFQTNILALNAAVEAARAGEQGRGFAVVASEVRNLAQRSATAAREIKTLIEDSVGKVDAGARLVDQAGSTMSEVVAAINRVKDIMTEITAASEEQSAGIEQVNEAITQMDQVTQQNAALVEETAAAAESMQTQARQLARVVSVFELGTDAGSGFRGEEDPVPAAPSQASRRAQVAIAPVSDRRARQRMDKVSRFEPIPAPTIASTRGARTGTDDWAEF